MAPGHDLEPDLLALRVTAGPGYQAADHLEVPVNQPQPVRFSTDAADIDLWVRIRGFRGLPRDSPASCAYFDAEPHASRKDQFSICMRLHLKQPPSKDVGAGKGAEQRPQTASAAPSTTGVSAADLQFGNDFDRPIRNRLPPGFNAALKVFKWAIDPGLDGDAYADRPYLYGPVLSSFNSIWVGPPAESNHDHATGPCVEEGGDTAGLAVRHAAGVPLDAAQRARWALGAGLDAWVWKYDQDYALDFFNPYFDFGNLAVCLPGFQLSALRWWEGQPMRYVLRNRATGEVYLSVVFTLHLPEHLEPDGSLKAGTLSWDRLR